MNNKEMFIMADRLKELKAQKKDLENQAKSIGAEADEIEKKLSDAMAENECERFSHCGSTFYLTNRLYASPLSGCKDEMMQRLKDYGYGSIVTQTVNANTLSSFIKEQREQNKDEIPTWLTDVVSTYEKTSVGIRKD